MSGEVRGGAVLEMTVGDGGVRQILRECRIWLLPVVVLQYGFIVSLCPCVLTLDDRAQAPVGEGSRVFQVGLAGVS